MASITFIASTVVAPFKTKQPLAQMVTHGIVHVVGLKTFGLAKWLRRIKWNYKY